MRAAVYQQYGSPDVVQIKELPKPEPRNKEVLIRIKASTVSSADWRARSLTMPAGFHIIGRPVFGLFGPRKPILGTEFAGVIEAVGHAVSKYKIGDAVFGFPGFDLGCHAEYRIMPEDGRLTHMPQGMSFAEAASISFGGTTALYYLRDLAKIQPGEELLIIGASGTVGSAAVQIAKHFGAKVSAVTSTANLERVSKLGADHVIDYSKTQYLDSGAQYDVLFDTVGVGSYSSCRAALKEKGRLLLAAGSVPQILSSFWKARGSNRQVFAGSARERVEDLIFLKELVEKNRYRPLIDRLYPLESIAEAHAYVETGRKRGSVVITMDGAMQQSFETRA
jgi:NADPH:quinone reductase-like Zn-dependent oxidoreductase